MSDAGALEELRLIFRGEVEDHVATLERESRSIAQGGDEQAAAREIYRAVHTLKGAARAVELHVIERACHGVEARLGEAGSDPATAAAIAASLSAALRRFLESGSEAAFEEPGPAIADAADRVPSSAGAARSALEEPGDRGAVERADGPRAAAPPPLKETARVAVARLGEIAEHAEELLGLLSRVVHDSKSVDDTLNALRNDVSRLRDAVRRAGNADASASAERVLSTAHTLKLLISNDRERVDAWRRSIAGAAREVVDRTRALRVVPLSTLSSGLHRATYDLASALGKSLALELSLEGVEVDRAVRDALREILLHLIRNALDHGIESQSAREAAGKPRAGRVSVTAEAAGRELRVTVEDDGRGLDLDAISAAARALGRSTVGQGAAELSALIFEPGLSTSAAATEVSGRGMGLDIVRQRIAELHGRVDVEARSPSGTRFRLVLPVDLSVMRGLTVRAGDAAVVVPSTAVLRLRRVRSDAVRSIEGRAHVEEGGALLPLVPLAALFGRERQRGVEASGGVTCYVVVGAGDRSVAVEVDAFHDERELVVRKPSARLRRVPYLAGVTVLDAGDVAVVLDVYDLVQFGRARAVAPPAAAERRVRALVVDDSITTRQLVRSILEAAHYDVQVASDGEQAWNVLLEVDIDVVVSDVDMPRVDGFQLLARIRNDRRLSQLPVVLVTALEQEADRQRAFDLGASGYIVKAGFDQDALLAAIEERL